MHNRGEVAETIRRTTRRPLAVPSAAFVESDLLREAKVIAGRMLLAEPRAPTESLLLSVRLRREMVVPAPHAESASPGRRLGQRRGRSSRFDTNRLKVNAEELV